MDPAVKDPWFSMTLEMEPGRQPFVLMVPLGLNKEQRAAVMCILADVLESMKRAYDPQPCPHCLGSGDARVKIHAALEDAMARET